MSSKSKKAESDEVTMQEAMKITGLCRASIYNRIKSGELKKLPSKTAHKRPLVKFLRADVEKLLNQPE
jgi:predicted DNA-binding transcriptional regulator AlpA